MHLALCVILEDSFKHAYSVMCGTSRHF